MAHRPTQIELLGLGDVPAAAAFIGSGSPASAIKALQAALVNAGFPPEIGKANKGVDGVWGPKTQAALMRWQQTNFKAQRPYADAFDQSALGIATTAFATPSAPIGTQVRPPMVTKPVPVVFGPPLPPMFDPGPGLPTKAGFGFQVPEFMKNPWVLGGLVLGSLALAFVLSTPAPSMGDAGTRRRARITRSARRAGILVEVYPDSGGWKWEVTRGGERVRSGWEPSKSGAARAGASVKRQLPKAA